MQRENEWKSEILSDNNAAQPSSKEERGMLNVRDKPESWTQNWTTFRPDDDEEEVDGDEDETEDEEEEAEKGFSCASCWRYFLSGLSFWRGEGVDQRQRRREADGDHAHHPRHGK